MTAYATANIFTCLFLRQQCCMSPRSHRHLFFPNSFSFALSLVDTAIIDFDSMPIRDLVHRQSVCVREVAAKQPDASFGGAKGDVGSTIVSVLEVHLLCCFLSTVDSINDDRFDQSRKEAAMPVRLFISQKINYLE